MTGNARDLGVVIVALAARRFLALSEAETRDLVRYLGDLPSEGLRAPERTAA
jgi:hypothetical protein